MLDNTQVIILAGGKGTRMSQDFPKVLTLIEDRALIEYLLSSIDKCNFKIKPLVVIGYKAEMVKKRLSNKVIYAYQDKQLGTGHAVIVSKDKQCKEADNIIVLYGDMPNISSKTILELAKMHNNSSSVLTMMTIKLPNFEGENYCFYGFGRILRGEDGCIERIIEVNDANEEEKKITELNPSLFCFDKDWLLKNLDKLNSDNSQEEYYLTDLVALAIKEGYKINSLRVHKDQCIGVNTPDELIRAERIMKSLDH